MSKAITPEALLCFPGHSCSTTAENACGTGEWAGPTHDAGFTWTDRGNNQCTEKDWLHENDLPGMDCPGESNREAARLRCEMSDLDESRTTPSTTDACV